jgi:hypothetical protein
MNAQRKDILQNKTWDVNHPKLKRLVDNYVNWCQDPKYTDNPRSVYENDILNCLNSYYTDGYDLAKMLADDCGISPDSTLVDILENVYIIKNSILKEKITNWVKSENLTIPDNIIGKLASAKQYHNTYPNHFITSIYPDTYEVTLNEDKSKPGGYVIHFENVTIHDINNNTPTQ